MLAWPPIQIYTASWKIFPNNCHRCDPPATTARACPNCSMARAYVVCDIWEEVNKFIDSEGIKKWTCRIKKKFAFFFFGGPALPEVTKKVGVMSGIPSNQESWVGNFPCSIKKYQPDRISEPT